MLWALISSAFVIYLYRKLQAEQEPQVTSTGTSGGSNIDAELDRLNEQISTLEARLANTKG